MKGLATGFTLLLAAFGAHAAEVADYRFEGTFASSLAGAPALQEIDAGTGAFAFEAGVGRTAYQYPENGGLALDASTLVSNQYTFVLYMRSALNETYIKLIDMGDRMADYGLYFRSDDLGFYPRAYGDGSADLQQNRYYTIVVTRSTDGEYTGYVDGVQRFRFLDLINETGVPASGQVLFFRDDLATNDSENAQGAVARLRVFDSALTPAQVLEVSTPQRIFANGFEG